MAASECDAVLHAPWRASRPRAGRAGCPFCAGRESLTPPAVYTASRAPGGGRRVVAGEQRGWTARLIPNLYPAARGPRAAHEVVVESPRHVLDPHEDPESFEDAVYLALLRAREHLEAGSAAVAVFKNRGPGAGASVEHAHSQIVALPEAPPRLAALAREYAGPGCPACSVPRGLVVWEGRRLYLAAHPRPRFGGELLAAPRAHESYPWEGPGGLEEAARELAAALAAASLYYVECEGLDSYNYWVYLPPRGAGMHWHAQAAPAPPLGGLERGYYTYVSTRAPGETAGRLRACLERLGRPP